MAAWLQLFKSLDWTSPSSILRCSANTEQRETGSTGLMRGEASSPRRDCWSANHIESLSRRRLTRQIEHRDCATRDHGRWQLAIPPLRLHEVNEPRISSERLAARINGFGLGIAAQLNGVGIGLCLEPHSIGLGLRLCYDDVGLHPLPLKILPKPLDLDFRLHAGFHRLD